MEYYDRTVPVSPDYRVMLAGENKERELFVSCAHQHQPGAFNYESELESFAQWPCEGPVRVCVEVINPAIRLQNVVVRPEKTGVFAEVCPEKRRLYISADGSRVEHRILSVEIDGIAPSPVFIPQSSRDAGSG